MRVMSMFFVFRLSLSMRCSKIYNNNKVKGTVGNFYGLTVYYLFGSDTELNSHSHTKEEQRQNEKSIKAYIYLNVLKME